MRGFVSLFIGLGAMSSLAQAQDTGTSDDGKLLYAEQVGQALVEGDAERARELLGLGVIRTGLSLEEPHFYQDVAIWAERLNGCEFSHSTGYLAGQALQFVCPTSRIMTSDKCENPKSFKMILPKPAPGSVFDFTHVYPATVQELQCRTLPPAPPIPAEETNG